MGSVVAQERLDIEYEYDEEDDKQRDVLAPRDRPRRRSRACPR